MAPRRRGTGPSRRPPLEMASGEFIQTLEREGRRRKGRRQLPTPNSQLPSQTPDISGGNRSAGPWFGSRSAGLPPSLKLRRTTVALAEVVRPAWALGVGGWELTSDQT